MKDFIGAIGTTLIAALCALTAAWLAWHHPLSAAGAFVVCAMVGILTFLSPRLWAWCIFPALPLAGLMTWTGWLAVEEMDLLVLAVAAGGNARLALGRVDGGERSSPLSAAWVWVLPLVLATLIALWRGLDAAGGHGLGWWQGYREPVNSVRLAKSLFGALVLLPLIRAAWRDDLVRASTHLQQALTACLLVTGLVVLWERLAFPGLLNFSSDYRATGLFWEMHVGGAAIDAVLAMTMPFAAAGLAQARTARTAVLPALALALGAYACLVTFSRVVYLAVPLGLVLWWVLRARGSELPARGAWAAGAWLLAFFALAVWVFPSSGYRGLLALLGAIALILPLQGLRGRIDSGPLLGGLAAGALGVLVVVALSWLAPKGAYPAYSLAWLLGAAMLLWVWTRGHLTAVLAALAAVVAVLAAVPAVGLNWGGKAAGLQAFLAALALAAAFCFAVFRKQPSWPDDLRWQGALLVAMAVVALGVGVFSGGAYMGGRLANLYSDSQERRAHWQRSLALLSGPVDWVFGKGLGRFPAEQALSGRPEDVTGDYRLVPVDEGRALRLTSGRHPMGSGEMFRLSQRVIPPVGRAGEPPVAAVLTLSVRTNERLNLVAEVCAKNLLYPESCATASLEVPPAGVADSWQTIEMPLRGLAPTSGAWFAPRPIVFSIAIDSPGRRIEIDHLSLIDGQGLELLDNGGFEAGMAHWYTSSDRHHLPWHAKNAAVHLLFEQGLLGLVAWLAALGVVAWRLVIGPARVRPLAAPLAAALAGLVVVGAADSLLDLPRVAFLGTCLLVLGLTIPQPRQGRGHRVRRRRA